MGLPKRYDHIRGNGMEEGNYDYWKRKWLIL